MHNRGGSRRIVDGEVVEEVATKPAAVHEAEQRRKAVAAARGQGVKKESPAKRKPDTEGGS